MYKFILNTIKYNKHKRDSKETFILLRIKMIDIDLALKGIILVLALLY